MLAWKETNGYERCILTDPGAYSLIVWESPGREFLKLTGL